MGMFDTITFKCPACGRVNDFQTKSGDCDLSTYSTKSVPVDIAKAIDGRTVFCSHCDYEVTFQWPRTSPTHVKMEVV